MGSIFIHIPKTGGISIIQSLNRHCGVIGHNIRDPNYQYLKDYSSHWFDKHITFSIVRNPYARLVSAYFYLKKGGINHDDYLDRQKYISYYKDFRDFVLNGLKSNEVFNQTHLKPQHEWICDEDEILVNFVGKLENIDEDLKTIGLLTNQDFSNLQHKNKCQHQDWQQYYDKEMKEMVKKVYLKDFIIFGYNE